MLQRAQGSLTPSYPSAPSPSSFTAGRGSAKVVPPTPRERADKGGVAVSDEQRAESKLKLAMRFVEEGMLQEARLSLQEILAKYQHTGAAVEGRRVLKELESKR